MKTVTKVLLCLSLLGMMVAASPLPKTMDGGEPAPLCNPATQVCPPVQ